MKIGELIENLNEYTLSEDYDPNATVFLVIDDSPAYPLMDIEPVESVADIVLIGWGP